MTYCDGWRLPERSNSVVDQAAALFEAGARRVEFGTPHGLTTARGLRLLGERVLPALRHDS